jgi:DNA-binding transcriptional ArsR family regulator
MPSKKDRRGKASKHEGRAATRKRWDDGSADLVDHSLMKALSHRLRTHILAILNERVASPNQLSKELDEGLSQVSYHIEMLKKLELIELVKTEPRRGAVEHFYRGVRPILVPKSAWDDLPPSLRAGLSVDILRHSFEDAEASVKAGIFDDPDSYASWSPLIVDRAGFKRIDELANQFLQDVLEVQAEANARIVEKGEEAFSVTVTLGSFLSTRSLAESKRATATKQR